MNTKDERIIKNWNDECLKRIQIHLILTKDERSGLFLEFCDKLSAIADKIDIIKKRDDKIYPFIQIHSRIIYNAIPEDRELITFLEILTQIDKEPSFSQISSFNKIKTITVPAYLKLFISQHCPFCPQRVKQLYHLPLISQAVYLNIIDGTLFPEISQTNQIKSVPTLLMDEHIRWIGMSNIEEIIDIISNRNPANLDSITLENIIKDGNASLLAELMIKYNQIFPRFFDLLTSEKWSVRLGAMVTAEIVMEKSQPLTIQIINMIWEFFHALNDQVKGDMLYIFGKSASKEALPKLKMILNDSYSSELKEIAAESIDMVNNGIQKNNTH